MSNNTINNCSKHLCPVRNLPVHGLECTNIEIFRLIYDHTNDRITELWKIYTTVKIYVQLFFIFIKKFTYKEKNYCPARPAIALLGQLLPSSAGYCPPRPAIALSARPAIALLCQLLPSSAIYIAFLCYIPSYAA